MNTHLHIIGILLILLALIHIIFPKYFNWDKELKSISLINRQVMKVHTFFIAFTVFLMGLLCLTSSSEIIETVLGRKVSFGLALFWLVRLFFQLFVYSSKLWKQKTFETTIHIVFTLLWVYFTIVFSIISFNQSF